KDLSLRPADYGVKKIDYIDRARFDPESDAGKNEVEQGYIPVEKIRLGKNGFVKDPRFIDGIGEIYRGKPTAYFTPDEIFEESFYATRKLNHPILLALRYLRLLAMNYYHEHGTGYPDVDTLFDIDPRSARAAQRAIEKAGRFTKGKGELAPYLAQPKFRERLDG